MVYFAPNTDQGFADAISAAVHDDTHKPHLISISWGGPENTYTAQATSVFEAAFADAATVGVTVFVAAGDNGSSDGVSDGEAHVDYPASSPQVIGCGGTHLDASNGSDQRGNRLERSSLRWCHRWWRERHLSRAYLADLGPRPRLREHGWWCGTWCP